IGNTTRHPASRIRRHSDSHDATQCNLLAQRRSCPPGARLREFGGSARFRIKKRECEERKTQCSTSCRRRTPTEQISSAMNQRFLVLVSPPVAVGVARCIYPSWAV